MKQYLLGEPPWTRAQFEYACAWSEQAEPIDDGASYVNTKWPFAVRSFDPCPGIARLLQVFRVWDIFFVCRAHGFLTRIIRRSNRPKTASHR